MRWLDETQQKASRSDDILLLRWIDKDLHGIELSRITRQ